MAQKLYEETNIQDIADAIREKNGTSNTYKTSEMGDAVRAIVSGEEPRCGLVVEEWGGSGFPLKVRTVGMDIVASNYFAGLAGFYKVIQQINLNEGIEKIYEYAFTNQIKLDELTIPSSVEEVQYSAFYMAQIKSITFKGTPNIIDANAFDNCVNLTDIYVPWEPIDIPHAPWGATNATIHYEYTV